MVKIKKEKLLDIYTRMSRIRKFEEKAKTFYEEASVKGSLHLYIGQEAIAATVCSFLTNSDFITSTHRGHGHIIAKGADLNGAMAELMGKETGLCKGRGGSMHIADMSVGILGANGIVGGGIPIAVGGGLAAKYKKTDQVSVSFFGDGASNEGSFHESLNLASLWKLPVIFVCENNEFGLSVPAWQSTSVKDIAVRAAGYNIPGVVVDGNDVLAIYEAMEEAIRRARAGEGPTLLECKTYRWMGHWLGDPQPYRTREEVAAWVKKCPIVRLKNYIMNEKIAKIEELDKIETDAANAIEQATKYAFSSPFPDPKTLLENVFFEE